MLKKKGRPSQPPNISFTEKMSIHKKENKALVSNLRTFVYGKTIDKSAVVAADTAEKENIQPKSSEDCLSNKKRESESCDTDPKESTSLAKLKGLDPD